MGWWRILSKCFAACGDVDQDYQQKQCDERLQAGQRGRGNASPHEQEKHKETAGSEDRKSDPLAHVSLRPSQNEQEKPEQDVAEALDLGGETGHCAQPEGIGFAGGQLRENPLVHSTHQDQTCNRQLSDLQEAPPKRLRNSKPPAGTPDQGEA